jgi:hypothetical protein
MKLIAPAVANRFATLTNPADAIGPHQIAKGGLEICSLDLRHWLIRSTATDYARTSQPHFVSDFQGPEQLQRHTHPVVCCLSARVRS